MQRFPSIEAGTASLLALFILAFTDALLNKEVTDIIQRTKQVKVILFKSKASKDIYHASAMQVKIYCVREKR